MPIAYSYMRFSSEKQAKGDSFRRQEELVKDYLEKHPDIELDTSLNLRDAGLSAYKGLHAKKGALGVFIRLVDDGKIEKGSYLLVEHFDRLSREEILTAQTQFLQLINDDIVVVTLADGREYSRQSVNANPMELFISIMMMVKANQESKDKAERVGKAWRQKMLRVADGVQLTKRVPFWINKDDRKKAIPQKVAIVKRIFKLSADGLGGQRITRLLNEEGIEPPTTLASKWGISSVKKVLNSEAVLGVLNTADGVRHEGYYPRVINEKLWIKTRFQGVSSKRTRDSQNVHPLSGLCVCAACGATAMRSGKTGRVRQDGTKNIWRTLVCANSMGARGSCSYQSIGYDKIVNAVIDALKDYQYKPPADEVGSELWGIGEAISALVDEIEDLKGSIKLNRNSPSLKKALTDKRVEYDEMMIEQARLKTLARPLPAKLVEGGLRALLNERLVENKYFKQVVKRIEINFNQRSLIVTGHDGTVLKAMIDIDHYLKDAI